MFLYFFQMKLTKKIGWVSLNSLSNKMFEFARVSSCNNQDEVQ